MSWRTVVISNPCRLSLKNRSLFVEPYSGESALLPLSDISALILESREAVLTAALLSAIADEGIALFSCDASHIPNGVFVPFASHSRHTKAAKIQKDWSEPFKKRAWQKIIKSKIMNQAFILSRTGNLEASKRLKNLATKTLSDDETNTEAQAAKIYWAALFRDFRRGSIEEDVRNSALNYGYAIIRGIIARSIAGAGLIGAFGLHHDSELNAFNLADDLVEPFRPFVDIRVWNMYERTGIDVRHGLGRDDKLDILGIFEDRVLIGGCLESIPNACEKVAVSLVSASVAKSHTALRLPEFSKG